MSQYLMATALFWENKKTKEKQYDFYDYFSKKSGINEVNLIKEGFELKKIKVAIGRTSVSELLNECVNFQTLNKKN